MATVRRPSGELQIVPCSTCIKESAAAANGQRGRPWIEFCPVCRYVLRPGEDCLVCRLEAVNRHFRNAPPVYPKTEVTA